MKNLELTQMEELNGGGCKTGAAIGGASYMLATGALIFAAASGPIGWGVLAIAFTGKALAIGGIVNACA